MRKQAPDAVIILGYFLSQARNACRSEDDTYGRTEASRAARAYFYLTEVFQREQAARDALRKEAGSRWLEMFPSVGLLHAAESCTSFMNTPPNQWNTGFLLVAEHKLGTAHTELFKMMRGMNFKAITQDDFDRVQKEYNLPGGGGGR